MPLNKRGRKSQEERQTTKIGIRDAYRRGLSKEGSPTMAKAPEKSGSEQKSGREPKTRPTAMTAKPSLVNLRWFLRIHQDGVGEVQLVKGWHGQS